MLVSNDDVASKALHAAIVKQMCLSIGTTDRGPGSTLMLIPLPFNCPVQRASLGLLAISKDQLCLSCDDATIFCFDDLSKMKYMESLHATPSNCIPLLHNNNSKQFFLTLRM